MFIRKKCAAKYEYSQIVESSRESVYTRKQAVAPLGRLDSLQAGGDVDTLLCSLGRFSTQVRLREAHSRVSVMALGAWSIGPGLIVGRLWDRLPIPVVYGNCVGPTQVHLQI
jgi:hypothetical protein